MPSKSGVASPITDPRRLLTRPPRESALSHLTLTELLGLASHKAQVLAKKEIELVRSDAEEDLRRSAKTATGLGIGGISALLTLSLILVAVVFALIEAGLPGWASSLIVAAAVLLVGTISALVAWRKRVREPLATSKRSLREGVAWAKSLR